MLRNHRGRAPKRQKLPVGGQHAPPHAVAHRHRAAGGGELEVAADAEAPHLVWAKSHDASSCESDLARVGPQLAVQHVEAGGLAGAVRADQRTNFPPFTPEAPAPTPRPPPVALRRPPPPTPPT